MIANIFHSYKSLVGSPCFGSAAGKWVAIYFSINSNSQFGMFNGSQLSPQALWDRAPFTGPSRSTLPISPALSPGRLTWLNYINGLFHDLYLPGVSTQWGDQAERRRVRLRSIFSRWLSPYRVTSSWYMKKAASPGQLSQHPSLVRVTILSPQLYGWAISSSGWLCLPLFLHCQPQRFP